MTAPQVTRVGLVGCAAAKLHRPAPARELYTSALFRKASTWVERNSDVWFILSAKHGLVTPDTVLEPYNVKLGRRSYDPAEDAGPIWDWAHRVQDQLAVALADIPKPRLVVVAGDQYRTILHPCQWPYEIPLKGLGTGQQLQWLPRELAEPDLLTPTTEGSPT